MTNIKGFDEYMNVTLFEAVEIQVKTGARKPIGMICCVNSFSRDCKYIHLVREE